MKFWNQSITLVEQLLFIPSLQLNVCFEYFICYYQADAIDAKCVVIEMFHRSVNR